MRRSLLLLRYFALSGYLEVKFLIVAMGLMVAVAAIIGPTELPDNRPRALKDCRAAWKDSGYGYRLRPYTPYLNSKEIDYICQVNVDGRWVDSAYVKVG